MTANLLNKTRLFIVCSLLSIVGCGGGSTTQYGTVTGTVTIDGKPAPEGCIVSCQNMDTGAPANAKTESGGTYRLYMKGSTRIATGEYKVLVQPASLELGHEQAMKMLQEKKLPKIDTNLIPKKYQTYETSKLVMSVRDGSNTFDIPLKP